MSAHRPDAIVSGFTRLVGHAPTAPLVASPGQCPATVEGIDALSRAAGRAVGAHGQGRTIGLVAPNGPGFLAGLLALRRAGARVVLLDPCSPRSDLRRTAAALGARALLLCRKPWPRRPEDFFCEVLPRRPGPAYPPGTAFVKLTSGSTGAPRGVAFTAEALLADEAALNASMGLRGEERIVAAVPMAHSYGFVSVALPALLRGSLVVLPAPHGPLSPLAAAHETGATFFPTVPAYLQAVLKISKPPAWPASLRLVVSAGAPLLPETAARFRRTYNLPVHAFYGASECGGICYDREGGAAERGTVGTAVEGVRVVVGEPSEAAVTVRSPAVGLGYCPEGEPRLGDGRFQANDLACWAGSELRLLGRRDELINVKGKKVDPAEVERVVATMPGVEEVVALGVPASGTHTLRVVVVCHERRLRYEDVLDHCRSRLPDHKVPRSILLVSEMPRTSRGKIDRPALLAAHAEACLDD